MNSGEFKKLIDEFDEEKMAKEIFLWLSKNINSYIDNYHHDYSLCFMADDQMPECARFEAFCSENMDKMEVEKDGKISSSKPVESMTEEESEAFITDESEKIDHVADFSEKIMKEMNKDKAGLEDFFGKLSPFYNLVAFYRGTPVERKSSGYIKIKYLCFENFSMDVTKTALVPDMKDGKIVGYHKDEGSKELVAKLPASFSIDFTISLWRKEENLSLF